MNTRFTLTVKDILTRKHFENCELVAGKQGLDRVVKWVHVFEVTEVGDLLKGDELILSTGFGWKENESLIISLVKQLINRNAAGLCIEVGKYVKGVPDEVKEIANENNFPILLFYNEVPFVEITQDIHSFLISQHYEVITNLENYSHKLSKKLLSIYNYYEILRFLQQYLNLQVIYYSDSNKYQFIPEVNEEVKNEIINKIIIYEESNGSSYVLGQSVQVLQREYARVYLVSNDRELGEFESLILDRTVTSLAQHFLRVLYTAEKRKAEEAEWILDWLQGEHDADTVREHLSYYKGSQNFKGAVVCIFKLHDNEDENKAPDSIFLKMMFQTIFDQKEFFVLIVEKRNHIISILINKGCIDDWKERVNKCITKLIDNDIFSFSSYAIGQYVNNLSKVNKSYNTAKETLEFQQKLEECKRKYYFEDLHMYRIISLVNKNSNFIEFVDEYLGPVINYDRKHNSNLMGTLKTYLECNGSKKETAKKIYVVRQTLYHRIAKLEKLLGKDFMMTEKRQAIEFSLLAYEYLSAVKELDDEEDMVELS